MYESELMRGMTGIYATHHQLWPLATHYLGGRSQIGYLLIGTPTGQDR